MLRHPLNSNLHLHKGSTFEGLPLMIDKGPFILEYLVRLKDTIELALEHYPRVLAIRADLRLPRGMHLPEQVSTNQVITRFFDSFKARIDYNRYKARERYPYAHGCKVRYVWTREVSREGHQHYHLLILLNRDAFYTKGRLGSDATNMISRMEDSWSYALGISENEVKGLVHFPENGQYRINRIVRLGDEDQLPELFKRASYLCKAATKSYGNRLRGFSTSKR